MAENLNNKETEEVLTQPATIEKVSLDSIQLEKNSLEQSTEEREMAFVAVDNIVKSFLDLSNEEKKAVIELIKSGKIKI